MTPMSSTMVALYLACGLVSATLTLDVAGHLAQGRPVPHRTAYALLVGLIWPVVLVGLLQLGSIAAVARQVSRSHLHRTRTLIAS